MKVKVSGILLLVYSGILFSIALFDLIASPERQPIKDMVTMVAMSLAFLGVLQKKKEFLFSIPLLVVFNLAFEAISTQNPVVAFGSLMGSSIPLVLGYLVYKDIVNFKSEPNQKQYDSPLIVECRGCGKKNRIIQGIQRNGYHVCGSCGERV